MNASREKMLWWGLIVVLSLLFILSLAYFIYGNYAAGSNTWQLVVSAVLLSIPLVLLYFSTGLLLVAAWQRRAAGHVDRRVARMLYRTPRIAGVSIAVFLAMFSLDVFTGEYGIWETLLAFVMHSLPSIILGILLVLAWRREWIGAVAFLLAGIFFMRSLIGGLGAAQGMLLLFSAPMLVIALLFWVNWRWKKELHPA